MAVDILLDTKTTSVMMDMNPPASTQLSAFDAEVLRRSAKWARFLGIVGLVMVGLFVIFSLFAGTVMTRLLTMQSQTMGTPMPPMMSMIGPMYTVVFLLCAALYFFPAWYLFRHGNSTLRALRGPFDAAALSQGFDALRKLFTFMGVLTIIVLCFYALGLLMVLGALAMAH